MSISRLLPGRSMVTSSAAAIDRLMYHCVILEMTGPSIRSEDAESRGKKERTKDGEAAKEGKAE